MDCSTRARGTSANVFGHERNSPLAYLRMRRDGNGRFATFGAPLSARKRHRSMMKKARLKAKNAYIARQKSIMYTPAGKLKPEFKAGGTRGYRSLKK